MKLRISRVSAMTPGAKTGAEDLLLCRVRPADRVLRSVFSIAIGVLDSFLLCFVFERRIDDVEEFKSNLLWAINILLMSVHHFRILCCLCST